MLRVGEVFKKDSTINEFYTAIEMLLGEMAVKEIKEMKVTVKQLKIIIIAILAQINEITYDEMEKRFQKQ